MEFHKVRVFASDHARSRRESNALNEQALKALVKAAVAVNRQ